MAEQQFDEVYSLLIPFAGGKLILPRVSVTEVTGFLRPKPVRGSPDWLMGLIRWQEQDIPLVSFEGLCGRKVPERAGRTRIAITYAISEQISPAVFAIMTQGYPYLIRVNPMVLSVDPENDFGEHAPVLNRLRMANERPYVPDLEAIESRILEALPDRRMMTDTATGTGTEFNIPIS